MKTIIAGSRYVNQFALVEKAVQDSHFIITEVVSGCACGVDTLGEIWAGRNNVPVKEFPADWGRLGKVAEYQRNTQMTEYADALIAVWDGESRGTKHMINTARSKGLKLFVYRVRKMS